MASQQAVLLLTVWYLDLNISRESTGRLGGTHSRGICNFQEPFSPSLDADSKNQKPNSKSTNSTKKRYVACPAKNVAKDTMQWTMSVKHSTQDLPFLIYVLLRKKTHCPKYIQADVTFSVLNMGQ